MTELLRFDLSDSLAVYDYVQSDAFVTGITGPVGSGKSVGSCLKGLRHASLQVPSKLGYRRSRGAIIRNTYPELRSTTIKTWEETFRDARMPPIVYSSPIRHHIVQHPKDFKWRDHKAGIYDGTPGLDLEVLFLALDQPKDVKHLKSFELTWAWLNEAAELPEAIIDMITARVGRFPPESEEGCQWAGIFYDTNADDDQNWTTRYEREAPPDIEVELPDGRMFKADWRFHRQPPAVLEVGGGYRIKEEGHPRMGEEVPQRQVLMAAGRMWTVNPEAENLKHLRPGYYHQQITNKTLTWVQRFLQAKTIFLADGKPWVPEFNQTTMVRPLRYDPNLPLVCGIDAGGGTLNPAAVWGQVGQLGDWRMLAELVIADIGLARFIEAFKRLQAQRFPGAQLAAAYIDPAGSTRDEVYETAVVDHLKAAGIPAQPAPTNDINTRREALALPMGRLVHLPSGDAVPGFLVDPSCQTLVAGLAGKWFRRKVQVAGTDRHVEKPEKNLYSHPGDACSYLTLGGGEHMVLTRNRRPGAPGSLTDRQARGDQPRFEIDYSGLLG